MIECIIIEFSHTRHRFYKAWTIPMGKMVLLFKSGDRASHPAVKLGRHAANHHMTASWFWNHFFPRNSDWFQWWHVPLCFLIYSILRGKRRSLVVSGWHTMSCKSLSASMRLQHVVWEGFYLLWYRGARRCCASGFCRRSRSNLTDESLRQSRFKPKRIFHVNLQKQRIRLIYSML